MSRRRTPLFLLLGALSVASLHSTTPTNLWRTRLSISYTTFLPGERIEVTVTSKTTEGQPIGTRFIEGTYLLDGKDHCEMPTVVSEGTRSYSELQYVSLGNPGKGEPTEYSHTSVFWVNAWCPNWKISRKGMVGHHTFCFRPSNNGWQTQEISCLGFDVLQPQGEDAAAFNLLPPSIRNLAVECHEHGGLPKEILEKYPDSTYAGYVLLGLGPNGVVSGPMLESTPEWIQKSKALRPLQFEQYVAFIPRALAFLKTCPGFHEQAALRFEVALAYLLTGKKDKGIEQLRVVSKSEGAYGYHARDALARWEGIQRFNADLEASKKARALAERNALHPSPEEPSVHWPGPY